MTNRENLPDTVSVPVELIKKFDRGYPRVEDGRSSMVEELVALLPKPKPRLVAVLDDGHGWDPAVTWNEWLAAKPDLLTLLDEAVDEVMNVTGWPRVREALKARIRAALGVTE